MRAIAWREFIRILRLLEKRSPQELGKAIERALEINALTVDVIRILLQEGQESPAKLFRLDNRPHLQDHFIPEPHIYKYSQLLDRSFQPSLHIQENPWDIGVMP